MNATLEAKRAAAAADELVREPWMDLPRAQLTVDQRKTLAEWEKRAMEVGWVLRCWVCECLRSPSCVWGCIWVWGGRGVVTLGECEFRVPHHASKEE